MTDQQHPITPPPELVEQWNQEWLDGSYIGRDNYISTQAARWGADQELEACCEWLVRNYDYPEVANPLRAARRPKPPSLKTQALKALNEAIYMADDSPPEGITLDQASIIRHALEQLDD